MNFEKPDEKLNFIEQQLNDEPCVNVISKKEFEERVDKVFNILWSVLTKTLGPGGSGTFISIYPSTYNSKDGFHIMKNIAFDKKLDQVISDLVMDICGRLNFTVGDGTTSAVVATKNIYDRYRTMNWGHIGALPRDIMRCLEEIKNELLAMIDDRATPIQNDDPTVLKENIRKVVSISSNGDEMLTTMISDLYEKLHYPAITCRLSKDGVTRSSIVQGFSLDVVLYDPIYINNDDKTMSLNATDVIIFDHRVTKDTYTEILKPLVKESVERGRHLLCIAPYYDEHAMRGIIRRDLMAEHDKRNDISLILTACSRPNGAQKVRLEDLAMLLNTMVITSDLESDIIDAMHSGGNVNPQKVFNIDNRGIDGSFIGVYANDQNREQNLLSLAIYDSGSTEESMIYSRDFVESTKIRLGYCDELELGMKESTFRGFYYNKDTYNKYLAIAKSELEEVRKKCERNGTFSPDLTAKQERYYALSLNIGIIEVGATSEMSQGYLKDVVDDAVKAAASAYHNGVILGCHVTLLQCIRELYDEKNRECGLETYLLDMLYEGFKSVYKNVLSNVLKDGPYRNEFDSSDIGAKPITENNIMCTLRDTNGIKYNAFEYDYVDYENLSGPNTTILDAVVDWSVVSSQVFDLSVNRYSQVVINSAETDKEILKATVDLMSLLITGNQLVLR